MKKITGFLVGAAVLGLAASSLLAVPGVPGLSAVPAKAATTADLQPAMNSTGTRIITVATNGQVNNYWKKADGFWYGPDPIGGTARSDSPVTIDDSGNHVVFINTSGSVVEDTRDPSTGVWSGPTAIGGTARAGSPLAFSGNGSTVAFTSGSGVVADTLSGGAWSGPAAIGGAARTDSPMAINDNATHVYFVDTSGYVTNDWVSNGAWTGASRIGGQAEAGSSIATSTSGNTVAFVDTSGNVVNDWVSNNAWNGPAGLGGAAEAGSPIALNGSPDHVYFVNSSGTVVNDWHTSSGWQGPAAIGGTATAGSSITSVAGGSPEIAFYDSGSLVLDWVSGGDWQGPGHPDTISANIKGGNWPVDNGTSGGTGNYGNGTNPLILNGLSASDTTAQAESDAATIVGNFYSASGANTVRIPINEATVSSSYWPIYVAAIQGMLTKGNVIIGYWYHKNEGGLPASMSAYWSMWDTVEKQFAGDEDVFFEPMNEPFSYSSASDLVNNLYTPWLNRYPSLARPRVILDGTGYAMDVTGVGALVGNTRLSIHDYPWWHGGLSESGFSSQLAGDIGGYASRTVLTEYGDTLTGGISFDQPTGTTASSGDVNEINGIRGMTDAARSLGIGSLWWPGIGVGDGYRLYTLSGTSLTLTNQSALTRVRYAWGQ